MHSITNHARFIRSPSTFSFTILVDETLFRYEFAVLADRVVWERLVEIMVTREKILFRRGLIPEDDPETTDSGDFFLASGLPEEQRLRMAFEGTRANQLFLNNTVYQQIEAFRPVFDWFKNALEIIVPSSNFIPVEQFFTESSPLRQRLPAALDDLDTVRFAFWTCFRRSSRLVIPRRRRCMSSTNSTEVSTRP